MTGARLARADRLAATTTDEAAQLSIAQGGGDTVQREALLGNPSLTPRVLEWIVEHVEFNPAYVARFAEHPGMTSELRSRMRTW